MDPSDSKITGLDHHTDDFITRTGQGREEKSWLELQIEELSGSDNRRNQLETEIIQKKPVHLRRKGKTSIYSAKEEKSLNRLNRKGQRGRRGWYRYQGRRAGRLQRGGVTGAP